MAKFKKTKVIKPKSSSSISIAGILGGIIISSSLIGAGLFFFAESKFAPVAKTATPTTITPTVTSPTVAEIKSSSKIIPLAQSELEKAREKIRSSALGLKIDSKTNFAALPKLCEQELEKLEAKNPAATLPEKMTTLLQDDAYRLWLARFNLFSKIPDPDKIPDPGWDKIIKVKNGVEFLNAFVNDREWLEEFLASGPIADPSASVRLLALLWKVDEHKLLGTQKSLRNLANSIALNGDKDTDINNLIMYVQYAKLWDEELLHPTFEKLDSREMRWVTGYKQRPVVEEVYTFAKHHVVPRSQYPGLCWVPGYKLNNFYGDSIHGKMYFAPWGHAYPLYEGTRKIGGVCGSLSHYGSAILRVHGLLSSPAGQPAHCAFVLRDLNSKRWGMYYSVNYGTGVHFSFWAKHTFPYMDMIEAIYQDRKTQLMSEQLVWTAKRLSAKNAGAFDQEVENLFTQAEKILPVHFANYGEHAQWLRAVKPAAKIELWEQWGDRATAGLKDYQIGAWDLLNSWLEPLYKQNPEPAFTYLKKYHGKLKQSDVPIAEQYNFNALLETQAKWWKKEPKRTLDFSQAVLTAQLGTKNYFSGAMKFGSDNLLNNKEYGGKFIELLGKVAESSSGDGGGLSQFLGSAVRTAATALNFTSFKQLCDLYDKLEPITGTPPAPKLKGLLMSKDGILRTSTPWNSEKPQTWRRMIDGGAGSGQFHTSKEKSPWAEVVLPGPVNITGVYIDNSGFGQNAHRQIPLVVWVSEDGKKWTEVHRETQVKTEYIIDLAKKPVRGKHIKVGRLPDAKLDVFHLRKIQVFADKKFY